MPTKSDCFMRDMIYYFIMVLKFLVLCRHKFSMHSHYHIASKANVQKNSWLYIVIYVLVSTSVRVLCTISSYFPNILISGFYIQRAEAIDPALRRSGRFDVEVEVTTPTEEERFQILKVRVML